MKMSVLYFSSLFLVTQGKRIMVIPLVLSDVDVIEKTLIMKKQLGNSYRYIDSETNYKEKFYTISMLTMRHHTEFEFFY